MFSIKPWISVYLICYIIQHKFKLYAISISINGTFRFIWNPASMKCFFFVYCNEKIQIGAVYIIESIRNQDKNLYFPDPWISDLKSLLNQLPISSLMMEIELHSMFGSFFRYLKNHIITN